MATKKSPLARQKDEHGTKEKLVDKLVALLGQINKGDETKDDLKARLLASSNRKLLRLFEVGSEVREKYGSVEKLADAVADALGRAKDAPFVAKLKTLTPSRLLEQLRAAARSAKAAKTKAA